MRLSDFNKQNFLSPFPTIAGPTAEDSAPIGDWKSSPKLKLDDFPIAPGPFKPTWESIDKNDPGVPARLREAKFGIWVYFGPQSAAGAAIAQTRRSRSTFFSLRRIPASRRLFVISNNFFNIKIGIIPCCTSNKSQSFVLSS